MNLKFIQGLMALLLTVAASTNGWAASNIKCGFSTGAVYLYTPTYASGGSNTSLISIQVDCLRTGKSNNAEIVTVNVNVGNGGSGVTQNIASPVAPAIGNLQYDFYATVGVPCTNAVEVSGIVPLSITVPGGDGLTTSVSIGLNACVPPPAASAGGHYGDTVALTIQNVVAPNGGATVSTGIAARSISVDIFVPERCVLTMPTGALSVNYTALTSGLVTGFKPFKVICGGTLSAATIRLTDATGNNPLTNGVVAGLNYTLGLNTAGNSGGGATLGVTPGGLSTNYQINASFVGGQAGSCFNSATCTQSNNTHYVTVTW
jgi:hypothetical protein